MAKVDTRKLNKAFFKAFQSYVQNINEKDTSMFHFCNYLLPVFTLAHPIIMPWIIQAVIIFFIIFTSSQLFMIYFL